LIPIAEKHGPYLTDYLWAEPDVDHLIECLSEVYENPEIALSRGKAAQQFITKYYSMDYVAGLMRDRLMEILQSNARSSHE
jgi:hypothetical protein